MKDQHPEMFQYIMQWVNTNHLKITELDDGKRAAIDIDGDELAATGS
jgi:hypothetical protein